MSTDARKYNVANVYGKVNLTSVWRWVRLAESHFRWHGYQTLSKPNVGCWRHTDHIVLRTWVHNIHTRPENSFGFLLFLASWEKEFLYFYYHYFDYFNFFLPQYMQKSDIRKNLTRYWTRIWRKLTRNVYENDAGEVIILRKLINEGKNDSHL